MPAAKTYTWNGETHTLGQWAVKLGVRSDTLASRWKRTGGFETMYTEIFEAYGETHTIKEWAEMKGINVKALRTRIRRNGGDLEAALEKPFVQGKRGGCGGLIEIDGEKLTRAEWAERCGRDVTTINQYCRTHSISYAEAVQVYLSGEVAKRREPTYTAHGQTLTIREWSILLGETASALLWRLRETGDPELSLQTRGEYFAEKARRRAADKEERERAEKEAMLCCEETARNVLDDFAFSMAKKGLKRVMWDEESGHAVIETRGGKELYYRVTLTRDSGEVRAILRRTERTLCVRQIVEGKMVQPKAETYEATRARIALEIQRVEALIKDEEEKDPGGRLLEGLKNRRDVLKWELKKYARRCDRAAVAAAAEGQTAPEAPAEPECGNG